jgi:hypothetical protein
MNIHPIYSCKTNENVQEFVVLIALRELHKFSLFYFNLKNSNKPRAKFRILSGISYLDLIGNSAYHVKTIHFSTFK